MVINSPLGKETTRECGIIEIEKTLTETDFIETG